MKDSITVLLDNGDYLTIARDFDDGRIGFKNTVGDDAVVFITYTGEDAIRIAEAIIEVARDEYIAMKGG